MIRIARSGLAGIALLCAAASFAPQEAHATTFADLTVEQFTDASTWIIEGRVTKVWTELDPSDPVRVWTRASVTVDTVLKGPGTPETIVIDSLGGTYGDLHSYVPGMAVYSPGERIFAFLGEIDQGRRLTPVSMFQGKYTVRRATGATRKHVLQVHPKGAPGWTFDHRFLPHPAPEDRVYLDELRGRVFARLDAGWDGQPIPGITLEKLAEVNGLELPITPGPEALR